MESQKEKINSILKQEIIKEFEQKKLGELIVYLIAQYPSYPYFSLPIEKIDIEYLTVYDIPFLASYIRYSDMTLLQSGLRSTEIREKLCFLHNQIGTISPRYRNFIWSDMISIQDLKRWIPLLKHYWIKERLLKSSIITESLKTYIDLCLDPNSYAFQILKMIDKRYPDEVIGIFNILDLHNQEPFYKFLKLLEYSSEEIPFFSLMACFMESREILIENSLEELFKKRSPLLSKIRESYWNLNQEENDLETLKNQFSKRFLGMRYSEFEALFHKIPPSKEEPYLLLEQLYETRFPIVLENLYPEFSKIGDFRPFLEPIIQKKESLRAFNFQKSAFSFGQSTEIATLQDSSFVLLTMSLKEYNQKKRNKFIDMKVQTDLLFEPTDDCMIAFEDVEVVSQEGNHCIVKGKDLEPKAIIAIDTISFTDINVKKILGLPIIIIDTESYAKRNAEKLNQLLEKRDWKTYINHKKKLLELLKNQPWLLLRYFKSERTIDDLTLLEQSLKNSISQSDSEQYKEQLSHLNREIEAQIGKQAKGNLQYIKRGENK